MEAGELAAQQALSVTVRAGGYVGTRLLKLAVWIVAKVLTFGAKKAHAAYKKSKVVTSLEKVGKYDTLEYVELDREQLKLLKSDFRKYGVNIAIVKDKQDPEHVTVFFKSKQLANVERALKNYLSNNIDDFKEFATAEELEEIKNLDLENETWNLNEINQSLENPSEIVQNNPNLLNGKITPPKKDQVAVTINEVLWRQSDDKTFVSRIPGSRNLATFDIDSVQQISPQTMLAIIDKEKAYQVTTPKGEVFSLKGDNLAKSYEIKNKQFSKTIKGQDLREKLNFANKKAKRLNQIRAKSKSISKGLAK